jgi:hypothetical protein
MNFDWLTYKFLNPDLEQAGLKTQKEIIKHFKECGIVEKRKYNIYQVYPDFNYTIYRDNYNDLKHLTRPDLERHWIEFGKNENRTYKKLNNTSEIKLDNKKDTKVDNKKDTKVDNKKDTKVDIKKDTKLDIKKDTKVSNNKDIKINKKIITFIIPTIGRNTLKKAITSVKNQTQDNWKCIIIFDGVDIPKDITNYVSTDNRFTLLKIDKVGVSNHAARVRNEGLKLVKDGWVGFLDDDDAISPYYVERMNDHIKTMPNISCIIFRMMYTDNNVLPREEFIIFREGYLGISFCYDAQLLKKGFYFKPGKCEDFVLLNYIRKFKYKIYVSKLIGYFVRPQTDININYAKSLESREKGMIAAIIN